MNTPNQKKHLKIVEINQMLTQNLKLEYVLTSLVHAAFDLVEQADTILLYSLKEDGKLHFSDGVGINKVWMKEVVFSIGESLAGHVFELKKGLTCKGDVVRTFMKGMTKRNLRYFQKGVNNREIKSTICVPLLYKNDCIGVLVVNNFDHEDVLFSKEDREFIELIANQAAIAIVNSKLFENLQQKNQELNYSLSTHQTFTNILIEGKGIPSILKRMSHLLKTTVTYSENMGDESFDYPIICANESFGYFSLKKKINSLTHIDQMILGHAATSIALEIIKQNAIFERELQWKEDIFQQIMDGMPLDSLNKKLEQLGLDQFNKVCCLMIEGRHSPLWSSKLILQKEKIVRSIEESVSLYCSSHVIFTKAQQLVIFLPELDSKTLKKLGRAFLEMALNGKDAVIGVGREVSAPLISESYQEAKGALSYGKTHPQLSYITYAELGIDRLWQALNPLLIKKYANDKLEPVFAMGKEYYATLQAFIENNGRHQLTAEQLNIHKNTLAYRLKRIEEEMNISFSRHKDWIDVALAIEFYKQHP